MDIVRIKQGDAVKIPVQISVDGAAISTEDIEAVEFTLGRYARKTWPQEVAYDEDEGAFLFPLTQRETFAMKAGDECLLDVRVKFEGNAVIGTLNACKVMIADAQSTEEL